MIKFKNKGFTLLELILVIALLSIVIHISYPILFSVINSFEISKNKGLSQQDFRIIQEFMVKELRYAKYLDTAEPDFNTYNSLAIEENDDGSYSFTKNGTIFPIKFKDVKITSTVGKLNISITMIKEDEKRDFTILLENNLDFNKDIQLTLEELLKAPLFYAYPKDMIND